MANLKEGCNLTSNLYERSKCMRPRGDWEGLRDMAGRDFCPKTKGQTKVIDGGTPSIDVSTSLWRKPLKQKGLCLFRVRISLVVPEEIDV